MDLKQAISALKTQKVTVQRGRSKFWFGNHEQNKQLFIDTFKAVDLTAKEYQHLPEYEEVIDWMVNTNGKGLFLQGDCGRGKSTIATGVLPVLFYQHFGMILRPYHADDIPSKVVQIANQWGICIDEIGVEPMVTQWGEKYEGFNQIINAAEARIAPMFITTNLTGKQILERYGERTLDRINRLCRTVKFKGNSLRS